ncbi:MAG: ferrous iron transport protein B [Desulfovibrio sp.]|nr:MAG: ferrous iron transport protein B [Desulfovibrio sp.]
MSNKTLVALAGQPNAGKSTIFNMLTGARQHVANYPGVTVEKKVGFFSHNGTSVELVDLPGTYSLTSYSLEERVARDFILKDSPAVVVNVADASNLKRHLFLTFQLLEMGVPVVVALNMMDVAESRKQKINPSLLEEKLGAPVIPTVGRKGTGRKKLKEALAGEASRHDSSAPMRIDYGPLENSIEELEQKLEGQVQANAPSRWLAVKLLENDRVVREVVKTQHPEGQVLLEQVDEMRAGLEKQLEMPVDQFLEQRRYELASFIAEECVYAPEEGKATLSDKADRIICNRFLGYPILIAVMYLMYYLSIELGYELTNYTWPALAWVREVVAGLLPAEGFITDPMLRSLILWVVDSVNALLNYIPIFLILFAYIAILEDLGYMPRMAFLLDAFFRRYGLHGQSTLPMVLGGVYVGGCAVPGVMACRAVPDERARLATILVVPMMNCLAKVPLYVLLIGIYFAAYKGQAMFFIATITVLMALTTAKLLNLTVLKDKESAPFIMEMPPYHFPTLGNIIRRAIERTWIYVKKITTVVAAVSVILFVLMQFPGISDEQRTDLETQATEAQETFLAVAAEHEAFSELDTAEEIDALFDFAGRYKSARMGVSDEDVAAAIDADFQAENALFFSVIKPTRGDDAAKAVNRAYKKLRRVRLTVRKEAKEITINNSFLGTAGRWMEPASQYAGFNWRVNVALLSALAAKENTVATLGALYQPSEGEVEEGAEGQDNLAATSEGGTATLEQRMAEQESGFTSLHALALMLFMALYPPCMATTMIVKVQSGAWKWMIFSLVYMIGLGAAVSTLVYTGGSLLGFDGIQAMAWFYGLALAATVITGLFKPQPTDI